MKKLKFLINVLLLVSLINEPLYISAYRVKLSVPLVKIETDGLDVPTCVIEELQREHPDAGMIHIIDYGVLNKEPKKYLSYSIDKKI